MNLKLKRGMIFIRRHYPTILQGIGMLGVPVTAYFAAKEAKNEDEEKSVLSNYKKTFIFGAGTLTALAFAELGHEKAEKALAISCNMLSRTYNKDKSALYLAEGAGATKIYDKCKGAEDVKPDDEDKETLHWFYDSFTETWFKDTWYNVLMANNALQDQYNNFAMAFVESYYKDIDIPYHGSSAMGFDANTLVEDYEVYGFIPFTYDEKTAPDGSKGFEIGWPIAPEIIDEED